MNTEMKVLTDDVIAEAEAILDDEDWIGYLLEFVNQGMFKAVYWLPSRKAVIKVGILDAYGPGRDRVIRSIEYEWGVYVSFNRMFPDEKMFPETVWVDHKHYGLCMIQEPCTTYSYVESVDEDEDEPSAASTDWALMNLQSKGWKRGLIDLHSDNIGYDSFHDPIILDWGYDNGHLHGSPAEMVFDSVIRGLPLPNKFSNKFLQASYYK